MTKIYGLTKDKTSTQAEMKTALDTLVKNDIDIIICEVLRQNFLYIFTYFLQYFRNIEEMEWAIELALSYGKPVAATLVAGPNGDKDGVSLGKINFGRENS